MALVSRFASLTKASRGLFLKESKLCISSTFFSTTTEKSTISKEKDPVLESIKRAEDLSKKYTHHIDDAVAQWSKCNEVYYGKDRDMVNYPPLRYTEFHPKVRLGFIPDSWFNSLYSRTGTTGPYVFLFGTTMFLLNKEIWVVGPHFIELSVFVITMTYLLKRFSPKVTSYIDKKCDEVEQRRYYEPLKAVHRNLDRTIEEVDEELGRVAAVPMHVQAKEENLDLQLESAYRERLQQVYRAVQRRLDYHVERENTRRRFQQHHMVEWIINNVIKGITPAQEKETLKQCVAELRRLSQSSKAVA